MLYANDSSRVWHVAKTGNDGNSGHAGQYPVNLANDAKLTIGAAVSAAASGDTIIIWPGDYAENVNLGTKSLTLIGTSRNKSRIVPATGDGIDLGNDCIVRNLAVEALSTGAIGIDGRYKSNLIIEDCDIYANFDGVGLNDSASVWVRNCMVRGQYDGGNIGGANRIVIDNCIFIGLGTYATNVKCRGLFIGGAKGVVRNSIFWGERSDTSNQDFGGADCTMASTRTIMSFENCTFYAKGGANNTGNAFGLRVENSGSYVSAVNCSCYNEASSAASKYDFKVNSGLCVVGNCAYSAVSGNVKILNALSPVDVSGRVNVGAIKDVDAEILIKAGKLLKNKAVQDKLTGAIRYYDDDNQTVILTHTPNEDEAGITRAVS
jgi:hypothetical protein